MQRICLLSISAMLVLYFTPGCNVSAGLAGGTSSLVSDTSRDTDSGSSFSVTDDGEDAGGDNPAGDAVESEEQSGEDADDGIASDTIAEDDDSDTLTDDAASADSENASSEEDEAGDEDSNGEGDPLPESDWSTDWGENRTYWRQG